MKFYIRFFLLLLCHSYLLSQTKNADTIVRKKLNALSIDKSLAPKIDGIIDEDIWQKAPIAKDFVEFRPKNAQVENPNYRSEVRVLYTNQGIYIAAQLYDNEPNKISKELTERDNIGNDDFFSVFINGFNDKQQNYQFYVTAAGVQSDCKFTNETGEDFSWNGVWYSAVKINEKGWCVEMMLPLFEMRFPKNEVQTWGINFFRNVQRERLNLSWNLIDNKKGSLSLYDGLLTGIKNIKPPVRLSFMPYLSSYINSYNGKTNANINGGMDVKYGINESFTFDMTLIPDFGQANFDNVILNLSPFEQQLQEQRSFFTEGVDLFNIGDLFYSRRIGGSPSTNPEINQNEKILKSTSKVNLFNAFKISGRTSKGLGIGFFNAITEKAEAEIENIQTFEIRKTTIEPWANYNVLVLDQRFNGNSNVSFVNTNTFRAGDFRDANSNALVWNIQNKKNSLKLYGNLKGSFVKENKEWTKGSQGELGFGKIDGNNRFDLKANYITKDWNINDLGYSSESNIANYVGLYRYQLLQPNKYFNSMFLTNTVRYSQRLAPFLFSNFEINHNNEFVDKKFRSYGSGFEIVPMWTNDIFEARTDGRFLKKPGYFDSWIWYNSDGRKKMQYHFYIDYYAYDEKARNNVMGKASLRYRISDKFNFKVEFTPNFSNNEVGFVGKANNEIIMGRRQRNTYETGINTQYTPNEKMTLSMAFRHYFSDVNYSQYYTLLHDGNLSKLQNYNKNLSGTYNSWNLDLRYTWWFAPGSQITLLYRNAIQNYLNISRPSFAGNYNNLFNEPANNTISLRISYFIDYNRVKEYFEKS